MKRNFIILLFISIIFNLHAQDNLEKLRFGIFLSSDNYLSSESFVIDEYRGYLLDYSQTNYKIGFTTELELSNGFSLNSGFNYSRKNLNSKYYCYVCDFIETPTYKEIQLEFIEVPLSVRYYFLPDNFNIFVDVGFINLFALDSENVKNNYNISAKIGGGIQYSINPSLAFQMFAEYNDGINNMLKEFDFKITTISFGIGMVVKIDLLLPTIREKE